MKKKKFHYIISGYRWAPESFQVSKGLTKDSMKNAPMTAEERHEVGVLFLTKGFETAVGYVKHIERVREHQRKNVITYGFRTQEESRRFVYCPNLYIFADDALDKQLYVFKKIRAILEENNGRVVTSTECDLDEKYRPMNIKENTVAADFSRPLCIPMGEKIIQDGLGPSYHPYAGTSKKVRPHKRRHTAPTR